MHRRDHLNCPFLEHLLNLLLYKSGDLDNITVTVTVTLCHSSKVVRSLLRLVLVLTHLNIIRNAAKYPSHRYIALLVPVTLNSGFEGDTCVWTFGSDFNFKPAAPGSFCTLKGTWCSSRALYYANSVATRQILLLSGDVELNPGWQGLSTEGEDYLLNFASEINRDSNNFSVAQFY